MKLEFYKLPFKSGFYDNWVYDANDTFAFQFKDSKHKSLVMETLNGNQSQHLEIFDLSISYDNNDILNNEKPFISIRDWESLMNSDYGLDSDQAKDIQEDLIDWIMHKLTDK